MGGDGIVGQTRQQSVYRVGVGENVEIGAAVLHKGTDQCQFHGHITARRGDDLVQGSAGKGVKGVLLIEARSLQELNSRRREGDGQVFSRTALHQQGSQMRCHGSLFIAHRQQLSVQELREHSQGRFLGGRQSGGSAGHELSVDVHGHNEANQILPHSVNLRVTRRRRQKCVRELVNDVHGHRAGGHWQLGHFLLPLRLPDSSDGVSGFVSAVTDVL
mmetsp:Transcript_10113/g.17559  ORF Transcript_10113/g.17559 Transcript_10113/m.17559 type:complete len:217 (-) Transcript_10113:634-1284(-)